MAKSGRPASIFEVRLPRSITHAGAALAVAAGCAAADAQEGNVVPGGHTSATHSAKAGPKPFRTAAELAQIQYGRDIAVEHCSTCHALDNKPKSPNPDAPPLRNALWRFEERGLATYFIEALQVGHGDMPLFDFIPIGTDALIAYLQSIKTPHDIDQK